MTSPEGGLASLSVWEREEEKKGGVSGSNRHLSLLSVRDFSNYYRSSTHPASPAGRGPEAAGGLG